MSAGPLTGYQAVFERYLDDFVASSDSVASSDVTGGQVELPDHPQPVIQPDDLERALNNPRVLFPAVGQNEPREWLRQLCTFALWLRYTPPHQVPRNLASRAARLRFAVWTLPPRMDWQEWRSLTLEWSWNPGDHIKLSKQMVVAEARAARDDWLGHLNAWEDDPWLAARHQRDPGSLESDLRWLTTTWPPRPHGEPAWPDGPGYLDLEPEGVADRGAYQRVANDLVELHWLPRGSLRSATAAALPDHRVIRLLPWLFPLAALVVVGLFMGTLVHAAACTALVLLVAGIAIAGLVPTRLSGLALLRVPAAAAVGLVVLMSLTPRWWLAPQGWWVGAGLLVIAALYLVLESRLNGAQRRWAYPRGFVIAVIGALHAFVLSLVVLAFVAPSMAERGECLEGWWLHNPWSARLLTPACVTHLNHVQAAAPTGARVG